MHLVISRCPFLGRSPPGCPGCSLDSLLSGSSVQLVPLPSPEAPSPICLSFSFMNRGSFRMFGDSWLSVLLPFKDEALICGWGLSVWGPGALPWKDRAGPVAAGLLLRRSRRTGGEGGTCRSCCCFCRLLGSLPVFTTSQTGLPVPPWCPRPSELLGASIFEKFSGLAD